MLRAMKKASIRQLVSTTKYDFPDTFYEKGILMIGGSTHLQYNGTYYQGIFPGLQPATFLSGFNIFINPDDVSPGSWNGR